MNNDDVQEEMMKYRQPGLLMVVAAIAIGLAACSGSSSPHVASLGTTTSSGTSGAGNAATNGDGSGGSPTTLPHRNPTGLLDDWTTCMRSHGDPDQVDPTVDADGVIQITLGDSSGIRGPNGEATSCATYLTAAQTALRGGNPVPTPNQAALLKFSQCMRANGIPDYPDPTTGNGAVHATPGSDLNPDNPTFQHATTVCGNETGVSSKFSDSPPQPGDINVNVGQPKGAPGGNGGSGTNSGSVAGG